MQSFGATLKFDPHFRTKWDNLNHFGGVFNEMSRACPGMSSSENDDFKFLKTVKK